MHDYSIRNEGLFVNDKREWLLSELYKAYLEARKHKRATSDEHIFEVNAMENLMILRDDILARRYKPSRGVAFIIYDPVMREIFAAPFRDRVVHHFLYNCVYEWWDRRFIYDSYSCRVNKGTLLGAKRLQHFVQKVSRMGTRETYVIKMDLQGYFMSLPRKAVFKRVCWGLDQQFKDGNLYLKDLLRYLWGEIIFDDPIKGVKIRGSMVDWKDLPHNKSLFYQPPGRGVVIGNLSSQLISNIYLDLLDRYVKRVLHYRYYGRYVDDFFIVVTKEELPKALEDVKKIKEFLYSIDLVLHPKKQYIQNVKRGVEFLGMVIYPTHIVAGKRFKANFYKAMRNFQMGLVDEESIISYLGYLKNIDGKKLSQKMFELAGFEYCY